MKRNPLEILILWFIAFLGEKYETDTLYFLNDIHLIRPAASTQRGQIWKPRLNNGGSLQKSQFSTKNLELARLPPRLMGLNMNWFEICFKLMLAGHKSRDMWRSSDGGPLFDGVDIMTMKSVTPIERWTPRVWRGRGSWIVYSLKKHFDLWV